VEDDGSSFICDVSPVKMTLVLCFANAVYARLPKKFKKLVLSLFKRIVFTLFEKQKGNICLRISPDLRKKYTYNLKESIVLYCSLFECGKVVTRS